METPSAWAGSVDDVPTAARCLVAAEWNHPKNGEI